MSVEQRSLFERFVSEAYNAGNVRILGDFVTLEHTSHLPTGDYYGPDGVRIDIATFRDAFPDLRLDIIELVEANNLLVCRYTMGGAHQGNLFGIAPSFRQIRVEAISIERFAEGKIAERWVQYDGISLLRQLGAVPGYVASAGPL